MNPMTWCILDEARPGSKICITRAIWNGAAIGRGAYKLIAERDQGRWRISCRTRPLISRQARASHHPQLGTGVLIGTEPGGYARVLFQNHGERQVSAIALAPVLSWDEEVVAGIHLATREALQRLWLALEAEELPVLENSATLTAAKVDLLPHQIVLTHRIANASPRRFLIADSVGLGKTIETALSCGACIPGRIDKGADGRSGGVSEQLAPRAQRDFPPRFRSVWQRRRRH